MPKYIDLQTFTDERGNLTVVEKVLPFEIKRVFWIYDVPGGEIRGSHAFKEQQEIIVAISGSFDVVLHDGEKEVKFSLNRSYYGLYIPKMVWRRMENFSTNSLALIVSDKKYEEKDYLRNFEKFKSLKNV